MRYDTRITAAGEHSTPVFSCKRLTSFKNTKKFFPSLFSIVLVQLLVDEKLSE